jgi:cell fate regulator YaaT (PSP1 superfamily)
MAELYVVEFKGSRRQYFYNTYYHSLKQDDLVIVQAEQGEHCGRISNKIETDVDFSGAEKPRSLLRRAGSDDIRRYETLTENEVRYKGEIIQMIARHRLPMKVVDVECQFDGNKITFFFTADHRVDFRALVRDLASKYRTRIELRQIGVRDEARRVGGYGICGREQCCNTFIKKFAPISTQHAREQDLTLNPSKISGNCGRLLCCLRYEVDQYIDVRKKFPKPGTYVKTEMGEGVIERIDVLNEEAVIRDGENIQFRATVEDIVGVESSKSHDQAGGRSNSGVPYDKDDLEALKKLDEPESD